MLGLQLDSVIWRVFTNLNDSTVLYVPWGTWRAAGMGTTNTCFSLSSSITHVCWQCECAHGQLQNFTSTLQKIIGKLKFWRSQTEQLSSLTVCTRSYQLKYWKSSKIDIPQSLGQPMSGLNPPMVKLCSLLQRFRNEYMRKILGYFICAYNYFDLSNNTTTTLYITHKVVTIMPQK